MLTDVYKETRDKMNHTLQAFEKQLAAIRTGKATVTILDPVKVNAYGSEMPINQVATLSAPDPTMLLVQPWDVSIINEVEKGILKADLGLNPKNDGRLIRVPIPPLSEERRKEFVKKLSQQSEDAKTAIRNIRRDSNDMIKELEKEKQISEDEQHTGFDEVQKITDEFIKKVDDHAEKKKKEVMTV